MTGFSKGKTGRSIYFSIFLSEVSQSPEKRLNIFLLKGSFLRFDMDRVFSVFGVLKALLSDLKASLALAGVSSTGLVQATFRFFIKLSNPDRPIHLKAGFLVTSSCVFLISPKDEKTLAISYSLRI